uniref:Immunoglobulin domain-containing protein n=1 Tax=Xiphophorus maculatus TaxID=8083 RepID=A0A3B5R836_XIPMA
MVCFGAFLGQCAAVSTRALTVHKKYKRVKSTALLRNHRLQFTQNAAYKAAPNKQLVTPEGSVTISCPYDSQSVNKLKFLCRGNRPSTCRQQAVITSSNTQNGRFRLSDDRKSRIFTVTISSLTLKDSGSYLCGVQRNSGFDYFSAVELEVKDSCMNKISLTELKSYNISGIEGRPVTLQCPNSGQEHDNKKFLCKGDQHNNCTDMMENQTKFKLLNVSSTCFSVIITELEAADAGTYYCGSDSQLRFIKIQLAVGETNTERDRIIKSNTKSRLRFFTTLSN